MNEATARSGLSRRLPHSSRKRRPGAPGVTVLDPKEGLFKIGLPGEGKGDRWVVEFIAHELASYGYHLATEVGAVRQATIKQLSRDRQQILFQTMDEVVELLVHAAYEEGLTGPQLCERGRLAVDTLDLVVAHPDPERLDQVADALEPVEVDDPVDVGREEAEARARLRLHALYQRIIRDSYSVADLRSRVSRQRLKQLRDRDRLFAIEVPFFKGMLYPRWQFELATGKPRAIMPELIAAGREAEMDAIAFHQTMLSTAAGGGDLSPVDLLDAGEEEAVLRILRAGDH